MTEEEARARVAALVDADSFGRLERLAALILDENTRQNLIARSTEIQIWARHLLDSVQLLTWSATEGDWLDIGTGGGFPGLAIAATSRPIILAEPRRKRAEFLMAAAAHLGLSNVRVVVQPVERMTIKAATISARAVASIDKLLYLSAQCAMPGTRWLLLRGRSGWEEAARMGDSPRMFHVEHSLSDPEAAVVVVEEAAR